MKTLFKYLININQNGYKYWVKFLTILGDIIIYIKDGFGILYLAKEYEYDIHGQDIRDIIKIIKPGDIVLRKYNHYLDSIFIPGEYSHSGIYIGKNKIVHAIAEGVQEIDVIDFFQCDKACVLRPKKGIKKALQRVKKWIGKNYDFKFNSSDSSAFYCHELTATAYKELNIEAFYPSIFNKEIKFLNKKYLADSFIQNKNFEKIISK